jgi:polar amino acid transport system permease protein
VLMVGQSYLEKRFGRGFGTTAGPEKAEVAKGLDIGASK